MSAISMCGLMTGIVGAATMATPVFGDAEPRSPSCTTSACHQDIVQRPRLHQPVAANRCDFCHKPQEGATPFEAGARHEFERAADNPELCYACHERLAEAPHVHEPVRMGLCVLCHDPHGGEHRALLRRATDRELCLQCHLDTFTQGDHVHGPVQVGACGACHDPHQSANRFRLRGVGAQQCEMCHQAVVRGFLGAALVHQPVKENCSQCHEPHSSANAFRLTNPVPTLCRDCHETIDKQVTRSAIVHKPVAEGKCGNCHEHHGSDFRRLLRARFTGESYEPFALGQYALCYGCHQSDQVTEAITTTATNFRNGDVNLHFKHVNQAEKGRTCRMCHRMHGSPNPRLIATDVPFGAWRLPLNFQRTETGGSCLGGCHRMRAYDRVNPVWNE